MSYCTIAPGHPLHQPYHDNEYGFPVTDESALFERLVLEINQAGLSWLTILRKRDNFRAAFSNFAVDRVVAYDADDRARLLADPGIIRNRLKVEAAITNAGRIQQLRASHGSFAQWLEAHHPRDKAAWVKLFKQTFVFTGGEITGEFLLSIGYLPGSHDETCPAYKKIARLNPPWMRATP
jgi:DNA-3-methyladenine glycosylase I